MCDLISRNELIKDIRKRSYIDKPLKEIFETIIDEQPTVSEKEILDKAIEEFINEAMKQFTEFDLKHGYPTVTDCKMILQEIAEKMKEVE